MNLAPNTALLTFALLLSLAAAVSDLRTGLIPNRMVLIGFAAGFLGNAAVGTLHGGIAGVVPGFTHALLGACACAPLPLALFFAGGLGGGDTKLFIALGSLLGPLLGVGAELYAFVAGALYVLLLLACRGSLLQTLGSSFVRVAGSTLPSHADSAMEDARRSVRFAPAICVGTAITLLAPLGTL